MPAAAPSKEDPRTRAQRLNAGSHAQSEKICAHGADAHRLVQVVLHDGHLLMRARENSDHEVKKSIKSTANRPITLKVFKIPGSGSGNFRPLP
jgi:hypothetical protein